MTVVRAGGKLAAIVARHVDACVAELRATVEAEIAAAVSGLQAGAPVWSGSVTLAEQLYRASYPPGFPLPDDAFSSLDADVRANWERVAETAKLHIVTPLLVQLVWLGVPVPVAERAVKGAGLQSAPHSAAEGA